jgi:Zn-dependent protease with chaperone function
MIAFIVCVIFFRAAEVWVFLRTSCIGQLILGAPEKPPGFHIPKFEDTDDRRLLESLIKATTAAGLAVEQVNVGIVEVDSLNAASLGNHTFLLFEGLGRLTPQQRDAVMAHEVAHDVLGHADQSKARHGTLSKAVGVLGALINSDKGARDQIASWTGDLVFPAFEKEQEFAADA